MTKRRVSWNGMTIPDGTCGSHYPEYLGGSAGIKNHVCIEKLGHTCNHKCSCGYNFQEGNEPTEVE